MIRNSITIYRKRANLTQQDIADKVGVKQFVISLWESGTQIPTMEQIDQLAGILDTTVGNLYDQKFLLSLIEMQK